MKELEWIPKWRPIETYDKRKRKPKRAAFFFPATTNGRVTLSATVQVNRTYGFRTCTHWLPLPGDPEPDEPG